MKCDAEVQAIDHRQSRVARSIHAVLQLAYAQEAKLLQLNSFAPLSRTTEDIQASAHVHLGAFTDGQLAAVLSVGPDDEAGQLCIHMLVVLPAQQRLGLGKMLVQAACARGPGVVFAVATAAANTPALRLYEACGFVPYRQGVMGPQALAMVKLRRPVLAPR